MADQGLKITVEDVDGAVGINDEARQWLLNAHFPVQFQKAMELIAEQRRELGRPFESDFFTSTIGRLHIRMRPAEWEFQPGIWVAGICSPSAGPYTVKDAEEGYYYVDLIECSWKHEYVLSPTWDTLEHEFAHLIEFRMLSAAPSQYKDWLNMGHGNSDDPYVQAMNRKISRAYVMGHSYHPGLIGRSAPLFSFKDNERRIQCGTSYVKVE